MHREPTHIALRTQRPRRWGDSVVLFLASVGAVLASSPTASAYRTLADEGDFIGPRVTWRDATIHYDIDSGSAPGASYRLIEAAVRDGVAAWDLECSSLVAVFDGAGPGVVEGDGVVTVEWFRDDWARAGFPPDAVAVTDMTFEVGEGVERIVDADIRLNDWDFQWTPRAGDPATRERSVIAVIAHEFGHALGLTHSCSISGVAGAPDCAVAVGAEGTTMFPLYFGPAQAELHADDVAGACFLYPRVSCEPECPAGQRCLDGACSTLCEGGSCDPPVECRGDADCGADGQCLDGRCGHGEGALGDPCAAGRECSSGRCGAAGYCTTACDAGCPAGYQCVTHAELGPQCEATAGAFGEECLTGGDCSSGLCLVGASPVPHCTRTCGGCPAGHECAAVEGTDVCAPPAAPPAPSAGCALTTSRAPPAPWFLLLAALTGFLRKREK